HCALRLLSHLLFFFHQTATTEIYTLSLHDALPICRSAGLPAPGPASFPREPTSPPAQYSASRRSRAPTPVDPLRPVDTRFRRRPDRKSTRLNSSHVEISYAVFCLKKKITSFNFSTH